MKNPFVEVLFKFLFHSLLMNRMRVLFANGTALRKEARSYTSPDEARGATRYVPLADQWVF